MTFRSPDRCGRQPEPAKQRFKSRITGKSGEVRTQPAFDDRTVDPVPYAGGQRLERAGRVAKLDPDQQVG
jgi:hypothetical protein